MERHVQLAWQRAYASRAPEQRTSQEAAVFEFIRIVGMGIRVSFLARQAVRARGRREEG